METATKVRMKATDFPREVLDLFDLFVHGHIGRREFVDRAGKFAFGGMTALAMFEALSPNYLWAQQVPKNDPRIKAEYVTYSSPKGYGTVKGLLARPANVTGKLPTILVIHENRGLNPYIEDVARRLAAANFIALAPDALTSLGGYPGGTDKYGAEADQQGVTMQRTLEGAKITEDFIAGASYLKALPDSNGKVGVTGFCFGGGRTNALAVRMGADIAAGAPYYGAAAAAADVPKIKAAMLVHHGELDAGLVGAWPAYEDALKANKITYEGYVYAGANHGFHNDTTPRYDKAAAELSWQRTLAHFNKYVRG